MLASVAPLSGVDVCLERDGLWVISSYEMSCGVRFGVNIIDFAVGCPLNERKFSLPVVK